jgi:hypothetical protein
MMMQVAKVRHQNGSNANFYEKALFVKPTWRPRSGTDIHHERIVMRPFAACVTA